MRIFILSFATGTFTLQFLPKLPNSLICFCALFLIVTGNIIWFFLERRKTRSLHFSFPRCFFNLQNFSSPGEPLSANSNRRFYISVHYILIILLGLALGFILAVISAKNILSFELPKNLEATNVQAIGHIASLPKHDARRISFDFDVEQFSGKPVKTRFLLSWYNDYPHYPQFKTGDKWLLTVRLKRPQSTLNPGEFDREASFLQNHIRAVGYVDSRAANKLLESNKKKFLIHRVRQYLQIKIRKNLEGMPLANMITALVIGDQSGIDKQQWETLRRTGTIHFMIIAGLHIGFAAGFMFFLGRFLWRLSPKLMLFLPAQDAGRISALFGALIYSALAGFSIPTQRALVMIGCFMIAALLRRNLPAWQTLLLGLFMVVNIDPLASMSSGFWLSFAAVAIIAYTLGGRINFGNKFRRYCNLQLALSFGLMPLTLLFFQQSSAISYFANVLTIPGIGFIIMPLSLCGTILVFLYEPLGHLMLTAAEIALEFIWHCLNWLASLPIATWQHFIFNDWIFPAALLGTLILLMPRGFPGRWLGLIWLLPLFYFQQPKPKYGEVWFTLLDVGQGLASVIQTQNHILVYDAGPKFDDNSDAGKNIVLPFLHSIGAKQVDLLVVSHKDQDHSGGVKSLINGLPVKSFITSDPRFFTPIKAGLCYGGQKWNWDGIDFSILHPPINSAFLNNDASCVLKAGNGKNDILLVGDIEKKAEKFLAKTVSKVLTAKIVVAPHHGSNSSSSKDFVAAANPRYVLFATGYRNRFHFPSKKVINRYLKNDALLLNTAETGAITFKFSRETKGLSPEIYRILHRRYWRY